MSSAHLFAIKRPQITFSLVKCLRTYSSAVTPKESNEMVETTEITREVDEVEVNEMRNKSGLWPQHLRMLKNQVPYDKPMTDAHHTIKYKRKLYGKYGSASGIDPGTLWPNAAEIEETVEYERIAFPYSIREMLDRAEAKQQEEKRILMERQQKISENVKKIEQWKREVGMRKDKKLKALEAAKAKREALLEEIRRKFGYNIDSKDARFQEAVMEKEKEMKKKMKEEKKALKQKGLLTTPADQEGSGQ